LGKKDPRIRKDKEGGERGGGGARGDKTYRLFIVSMDA
jgi:hypothetical protein